MSDFTVEIYTDSPTLDIESSIINSLNIDEVTNAVETILSQTVNSVVEVESSAIETLEISTEYTGSVVFASDIIGLENYLANFIDSYEIDCGTP